MKKSQTVNQYLNLSKTMDNMLNQTKIDFGREVKSIIDITLNQIEKIDLDYYDNKEKIKLIYKIDVPIILYSCFSEKELENLDKISIELATIDLITEVYYIHHKNIDEYIRIVKDMIKTIINAEVKLNEQKAYIEEKSQKFFYRLFHPKYKDNINYIINYLNEGQNIKNSLNFELRYFDKTLTLKIIETFISECISNYGIEFKLVKEE